MEYSCSQIFSTEYWWYFFWEALQTLPNLS
jgi:hypothetical protein